MSFFRRLSDKLGSVAMSNRCWEIGTARPAAAGAVDAELADRGTPLRRVGIGPTYDGHDDGDALLLMRIAGSVTDSFHLGYHAYRDGPKTDYDSSA